MDNQFTVLIDANNVKIKKREDGEVILKEGDKETIIGNVLSAYPISNKGRYVSIKDQGGEEIGLLNDIRLLDDKSKHIMNEELERSYFMPKILDVMENDEKLDVTTMKVMTDKGLRTLQVRIKRQNFRHVGSGRYILKDVDGNRFEISHLNKLSTKAQNIIWEYI